MERYMIRKVLPKGDADDLTWQEIFGPYGATIQPVDPPSWVNDERTVLVMMEKKIAERLQQDIVPLMITPETQYDLAEYEPHGTD